MADAFETQPYEVRCHACNVSFPIGTKSCIHCGDRIGGSLFRIGHDPGDPDLADIREYEVVERTETETAEAEPLERGGFFRFGVTALWVLIAIVSAAVRSCQEGG